MILSFERRHSLGYLLRYCEEGEGHEPGEGRNYESKTPESNTPDSNTPDSNTPDQTEAETGRLNRQNAQEPGSGLGGISEWGGWSSGSSMSGFGGVNTDPSVASPPSITPAATDPTAPATVDQQTPADPRAGIRGMLGYGTQNGSTVADRAAVNGVSVEQQMKDEGVTKSDMYDDKTSYNDLRGLRNTVGGKADAPGHPNQTLDQAIGIKDYVEPAVQGLSKVIDMATPMGTMKNVARAVNKAIETGDWSTAALDLAKGYLSGQAMGIVNRGLSQALGPDVSKTLGQYNKLGSVVNAFGGNVPTINPAGIVADALGLRGSPSLSGTRAVMPDGTTPQFSNGSESRGGSSAATTVPAVTVQSAAPATTTDAPIDGSMGLANSDWYQAITKKRTSRGW